MLQSAQMVENNIGIAIIDPFIGHIIKNKFWLYAIIVFLIGVALEDMMFSDFLKIKDNCHGEKLIDILKKNPGT